MTLPNESIFDPNETEILSAINELASNTAEMIRARRKNERIRVDASATLVPADLDKRESATWTGVCHDISSSGCRLVIDRPIPVGNVFLLTLDTEQMKMDPVFVRCIRCNLIREDSFEVGVSFFSEIKLAGQSDNSLDDLSL